MDAPVARSERGRRQREQDKLTPIQQIRTQPHGVKGSWCYYLRPDGATIRDALVLSPNGGVPDETAVSNPRLRAKYGTGREEHQARARRKGYIPLGQTLTEEAMIRLVEILAANKEDEILFLEDEIAMCDYTIQQAERPDIRDQARQRKADFQRRIDYVTSELDPEVLGAELKEIARAQQLASVDPNVLKVMRSMLGEVQESLLAKVAAFQAGKTNEGEKKGSRGTPLKSDFGATSFDADGKDFIDIED